VSFWGRNASQVIDTRPHLYYLGLGVFVSFLRLLLLNVPDCYVFASLFAVLLNEYTERPKASSRIETSFELQMRFLALLFQLHLLILQNCHQLEAHENVSFTVSLYFEQFFLLFRSANML
jgi:hypothetical protein